MILTQEFVFCSFESQLTTWNHPISAAFGFQTPCLMPTTD